jgi:adenylosuccinate synthase
MRLLGQRIGSTLTGTGAAVSKRVNRLGDICLAHEDPELSPYVRPPVPAMRSMLNKGQRIVIEGTQGHGLSLLHSQYYPFTTSRDTTAAGFVSEAGLSPLDVDDVALVIRAFPIRVGGNSGPLPREISWDLLTIESRSTRRIVEFTSVTKRQRRVARFDPDIVNQAIASNKPTRVVLNHVDYIDSACGTVALLSIRAQDFVRKIEQSIGRKVAYIGTGPDLLIERESVSDAIGR